MRRYITADWFPLVSAYQTIEDVENNISVELLVFTHLGSGFFVNPDFVCKDALTDLLQRAASTYYDLVKFCHAAQTMYQYTVPKTVEKIDEMLSELQWLEGHGIGHNRLSSEHFDDIAWAISNLNKHKKNMLKNTVIASESAEPGYIYLVQAITPTSHYKIGYSKTPDKRIERMDVKLPFPIDVLKHIPTDDMRRAEKILHNKYARQRVNGEWFELSDSQVAEICTIESMMFGGAA